MVYTTIITVHYTTISLFYVYTILLIINCVQSKFNIANRIRNILIQIMCMLEILSYIGIDNGILNLTYDNVQKISWCFSTPLILINICKVFPVTSYYQIGQILVLNETLMLVGVISSFIQYDYRTYLSFYSVCAVIYSFLIIRLSYLARQMEGFTVKKYSIYFTMTLWCMFPILELLKNYNTITSDEYYISCIVNYILTKGVLTAILTGYYDLIENNEHSIFVNTITSDIQIVPEECLNEIAIEIIARRPRRNAIARLNVLHLADVSTNTNGS